MFCSFHAEDLGLHQSSLASSSSRRATLFLLLLPPLFTAEADQSMDRSPSTLETLRQTLHHVRRKAVRVVQSPGGEFELRRSLSRLPSSLEILDAHCFLTAPHQLCLSSRRSTQVPPSLRSLLSSFFSQTQPLTRLSLPPFFLPPPFPFSVR